MLAFNNNAPSQTLNTGQWKLRKILNPSGKVVTPLPHRLSDGSVILHFQLGKWDPEEIPLEAVEQIVFMVFQQQLRHPLTQIGGIHIIHDFKDTGFRHLKYCTLQNMILLNHISFV
ncbi:hypothetical protein AVEN_88347-1, partial [Araneus ventricosus]